MPVVGMGGMRGGSESAPSRTMGALGDAASATERGGTAGGVASIGTAVGTKGLTGGRWRDPPGPCLFTFLVTAMGANERKRWKERGQDTGGESRKKTTVGDFNSFER